MSDEPEDGGWSPADVAGMIANPFYAIQIDPTLAVPHETLLGEDQWVQANTKLIEELGATAYLRNLLVVLKGGFVGDVPLGYQQMEPDEHREDGSHYEHEHAEVESDVLEEYVVDRLLARLETEPGFISRSVTALEETELDEDLAQELEELEADPEVLLDVVRASRATWSELVPEAHRLLIIYTIDEVVVGGPSTPIEEMFDIRWRVEPPA